MAKMEFIKEIFERNWWGLKPNRQLQQNGVSLFGRQRMHFIIFN